MRSTDRRGFTLVELMVAMGIIAMLIAAFSASVAGARKRASVAKAQSEVKVISQAILAYENYNNDIPTCDDKDADRNSLGFLIGQGENADSGGKIPPLLMASLTSGGKMLDPWHHPYKIRIRQGKAIKPSGSLGQLYTGCIVPNLHRLSREERE